MILTVKSKLCVQCLPHYKMDLPYTLQMIGQRVEIIVKCGFLRQSYRSLLSSEEYKFVFVSIKKYSLY